MVQARPDETIHQLKLQIETQQNLSVNKQCLIFNGKELENNQTLSAYGVRNKSLLHLAIMNTSEDQINVVIFSTGMTSVSLNAKGSTTIAQLKNEISKRKGVPFNEQCLLTKSKGVLHDSRTLSYYRIENDSKMQLIVLPRDHIKIFVESTTGKRVSLHVNQSERIDVIMSKIEEKLKLTPHQYCLTYNSKVLEG